MIAESVAYLVRQGREVIYDAEHFFDGWKANPEFAAQTIRAAAQAGAKLVVLCDTNGGSMPEEIAELTRQARAAIAEYSVGVGIHCHNDCELAVANSLAAVDAGAVQVQGHDQRFWRTMRQRRLDLRDRQSGHSRSRATKCWTAEALEHLTELSRYVYEIANMNFRTGQPFVGPSAFAHKGGMHVHAIARATSSYEHINPEKVGNERRILLSELSGRSNIVALTTRHNIQHDRDLMDKILAQVVSMENDGYQFEAAEATFDLLVEKCVGTFRPHFRAYQVPRRSRAPTATAIC